MKAIELEKAYNPKDFEDRLYQKWETEGYFKPSSDENSPIHSNYTSTLSKLSPKDLQKATYTVVIPPPNVTGVLHIGHGLNNTLQDIVVRYHRMKGDDTLWVPGTDHAGIATQNVVERRLKKEGLRRQDLGRDKFLERTWAVKKEHHDIIAKQQRKLGNSVDWSRERFTLDEGLSVAVRDVFVTLYERGLIYKGHYLVNWCPSCGTALADDEVEHEDTAGGMYHMYYEICDEKGNPVSIPAVTLEDGSVFEGGSKLEIATTRPETLFGDTAVAVHPEDPRYFSLKGKFVKLALTDKIIPVVMDTYVDRAFGTGVVKITPAHDPNDWDVGKRHNLPVINILNPDATLNDEVPQKYRGMTTKDARKVVIEDLKEAGLYKNEEKITHPVGHCYRCHSVVEPYLSDQWFVKMRPLADKALKAWKNEEIVFYPRKWENTYSHWMENIRDWCISRQLWWGHRIPVWYCETCGEMIVSRSDPTTCPKCGASADKLKQETDVLDTWFSSWLWPFSTLGWPSEMENGGTKDFKRFYPTTALVTAYDIIFFWVSRMIMAGLEFTGKVPFKDIYIHGLVRDKQGRKMSKSLGNGIDPLEIIEEYGSDALKFTLAFMAAQGQDILIDKDSFKMGSRFANKVWNASRYLLGNLEGRELLAVSDSDLSELDKWIFGRLDAATRNVRSALENYRYNDAAQAVYEYFWNDFCDWYVEATKLSFKSDDENEKNRITSVLMNILEESLRLLHPFLPFVTEEIYQKLPLQNIAEMRAKAASEQTCCEASYLSILSHSEYTGMLIAARYPEPNDLRVNPEIEARFSSLQEIVRSIRGLRSECGIDPALKISVVIYLEKNATSQVASEKCDIIQLLAGLSKVEFINSVADKPKGSIGTVGKGFEAFIIVSDGLDPENLKSRFEKEIQKEQENEAKLNSKLSNEKFIAHAPQSVVDAEREKLAEIQHRIEKLKLYVGEL